jgi:hypothetical protein
MFGVLVFLNTGRNAEGFSESFGEASSWWT